MVTKGFIKELTKIVGRENVLFSPRDLLAYSYDATQHQSMPEVIVFAHSTAEIAAVMKVAHRERMPVIPRGAGTGLSGGTVAITGGMVIELSRMNRIISLDTASRRAIVEPGVINLDLQDALAPLGFMYPPDPASQKSCTMGGNIGENAGGPLCFRYGVTSKYVCGMEVVIPTGEVVEVGAGAEDVPGYDLRGLLIGSEGILGIATRLILHILPLPEASRTMLAVFDTLQDAGQAVSDIINAGMVPAALELMDRKMCWAIEQSIRAGYPTDAEGVLLIEVAGLAGGLDRQVTEISEICKSNMVRELRLADTGVERDTLWKGRKGAFGSVARLCPNYLVNDGTVPRNKLVEALRAVHDIAEKYNVAIANVAHAGDGNLHPLILFDPYSPDESKAAKQAGEDILDACLTLGGTISGEHGIGTEKLAAMPRMFGLADLATMRKVKQVFDPDGILNPGKLIPAGAETAGEENIPAYGNVSSHTLYQRLAQIVGSDNLKAGEQVAPFYVDGLLPGAVVFPATTGQVSQIVGAASELRKAVIPRGGGSKQHSGFCIVAGDIILCMENMNQIIDLDTGNSTVRVGAGMINNQLQQEMAKYGLFFPLAPSFLETSTIGGELATGDSGLCRFMYGTARDLVLGLTVVTPTGEVIHPGGKTMKNVAGLDLVKMYIGSWGTLGVITEAVLRLFPLPETNSTICLTFPGVDNARGMVNRLLNSALQPTSIELIDGVAGRYFSCNLLSHQKEDEILLLVNVEGSREVVERHLKDIGATAEENGAYRQITAENGQATEVWNAYRRVHPSFFNEVPSAFKGKASVPISETGAMFKAVKEISGKNGVETGITAHCGNGILCLYCSAGNDGAITVIDDLKQAAARLGGFFIVESGPLWLRKSAGVWHRPGAYTLMERLKRTLDPNNILNPGKVVGGQY